MTPLEAYLHTRMGKAVQQRIAWDHRARHLPSSLDKFVRGKLWRWPYRHMRGFSRAVQFEQNASGGWQISVDDEPVANSVSLPGWVGSLKGRGVTIVAGGPSARDYPISELRSRGRFIVAVNGVPSFLAESGVKADAVVISDLRLASQIAANFPYTRGVPLAIPAKLAAVLAMRFPEELASRPLCLIERINQWYGVRALKSNCLWDINRQSGTPFIFPAKGNGKSVVGWSQHPELGFFSGNTVAFVALQIVVGLGASDIEIVGMDLTGQSHAYHEGHNALPSGLDKNYQKGILPSFELMHEALVGTGVSVRNHSPVCPLPEGIFRL